MLGYRVYFVLGRVDAGQVRGCRDTCLVLNSHHLFMRTLSGGATRAVCHRHKTRPKRL